MRFGNLGALEPSSSLSFWGVSEGSVGRGPRRRPAFLVCFSIPLRDFAQPAASRFAGRVVDWGGASGDSG